MNRKQPYRDRKHALTASAVADIQRCNICRLTFMSMEKKLAFEIFGMDAIDAFKCCSRTCYRKWHSRTIKEEPGSWNLEEPGRCPFQFPDRVVPCPVSEVKKSSSSEESDVKMLSPRREQSSTSSQSSSESKIASPRLTPRPLTLAHLQPKSAVKAKPQPKRLHSTRQLIQVKHEELTTWQTATGKIFAASLGVPLEVEVRSGKQLEAIYIQRYVRPLFPESKTRTMETTFRKRDTASVSAG